MQINRRQRNKLMVYGGSEQTADKHAHTYMLLTDDVRVFVKVRRTPFRRCAQLEHGTHELFVFFDAQLAFDRQQTSILKITGVDCLMKIVFCFVL
jgi:hypothetical protein